MDNSSQNKKAIPGLRTFAKDLESKRVNKAPANKPTRESKVSDPKPDQKTVEAKLPPPIYDAPKWKKSDHKVEATKPSAISKISADDLPEEVRPPSSLTSREPNIVIGNSEDNGGATIIRDTKRNRFQLFPAISASINGWVNEFKQKQKERRKPKYSVPDSIHRRGVIQKATSKTGKVASFDAPSIQDRIREREAKTKPQNKHTFWSPKTESIFGLLSSPKENRSADITDKPANVVLVPKKSFINKPDKLAVPAVTKDRLTESELPKTTIKAAPLNQNKDNPNTVPTSRIAATFSVTEPNQKLNVPTETLSRQNQSSQTVVVPEQTSVTTSVVNPEITTDQLIQTFSSEAQLPVQYKETETEYYEASEAIPEFNQEYLELNEPATGLTASQTAIESPKKKLTVKEWLLIKNTNRLSAAVSAMVLVSLILGSGIYLIVKSQISNLVVTQTFNYKQLISAPLQPVVINPADQQNLTIKIKQNVTESGYPLQQIVLVRRNVTNNREEPLPPNEVLSYLNFTTNVTLNLSLSDFYFGSINQRPFLLMQTTNFNSARGALLAWESTMYNDLTSLLNLPPNVTGQYRDVIIKGIDTRIFRNPNDGTELFLYGIVNRNLIIIAQNRLDFETIADTVVKP